MPFVGNTPSYGGAVTSITTNDGFIYVGGGNATGGNRSVAKYYDSNLALVGFAPNYGAIIRNVVTSNGYIFAGGDVLTGVNRGVSIYHESNLVLVGNTVNYGGSIRGMAVNNGAFFVVGQTNNSVKKFSITNQALLNTTFVEARGNVIVNNGYVYASGGTPRIQRLLESNLGQMTNSANFSPSSVSIYSINNGYIIGTVGSTLTKFAEPNMVRIENNPSYTIDFVSVSNGFIYGTSSSGNNKILKFYESNLAYITETTGDYGTFIATIKANDTSFYVGSSFNLVSKYATTGS
jgi:hypothetical protein